MSRGVRTTESSVHCPSCGVGAMNVIDSRPSTLPGVLRQRRTRCLSCLETFTTHEILVVGEADKMPELMRAIQLQDEISRSVISIIKSVYPELTSTLVGAIRAHLTSRRDK